MFLFIVGLNLFIAYSPSYFNKSSSFVVLIPLNGLLLVSIIGAYFIGFSIGIKFLVPTLLIITLVGSFLNLKFNFDHVISLKPRLNLKKYFIFYALFLTPIILLLIFPDLQSNYSTSFYRIGPDLGSYAKMSQFLIDGGTWSQAGMRSHEFIGMTPGEINRYSDATMSWPFMYYFRWGLTAFQVVVTTITFSKHSFETAFISMAFPYMLMCGMVFIWLRQLLGLSIIVSIIGTIAFSFNSNLLNLWYEGFYGNTYALGFFIPILYIFLHFRGKENHSIGDTSKSIVFLSILFAASLLSYAEGVFFVLAPFMIILFIVDFIINKSINWSPYLLVLIGACIGLIIVFPCGFIVKWVILAIKQITQQGGNGFEQPLWALPNEIIGIYNIYLNAFVDFTGKLIHRTYIGLFSSLIISVFIFYSIFIFIQKRSSEDNVLYIASILMVVISALLVRYKNPGNNYSYMKMYVFHLPFLFMIFWGSLNVFYEKHRVKLFNFDENWMYLLVTLPIVLSGIFYIIQYKEESIPIEKFRIELHLEAKKISFDNVILYPFFIHKSTKIRDTLYRVMYPAVLSMPWMIPSLWEDAYWKDKPFYKNFMNYKVYLLIEKEPGHIYTNTNKNIVFENKSILIIDSGKTVKDGISIQNNTIDYDTYTHNLKY